jgi:glucose/arabinose dehydrogenase
MKALIVLLTAIAAGLFAKESNGQPIQPIRLIPYITSGLSAPLFVCNAGDGSNRLFILQQGGVIRVVQPGSTNSSIFLDISSRTSPPPFGERGHLGLAFHPDYENNRRFFVYYTRAGDGAIQIAEYQASIGDPNIADATEKIIITIPHPNFSNHNGGTVAFGPDGYLYAGPGDGGSGNDPNNNAQNTGQLLGKIIRLDVNNVPAQQVPQYNIPPDNPYVGLAGLDEIFAIGMRNPYRFSFDRGGTSELWAADVGQGSIEEVDIIGLGGNYGWRVYEGTNCTGLDPSKCTNGAQPIQHTPPIFQYGHTNGRCSVTGGYVYRGPQNNLPQGSYIYGDYCSGEIFLWHNGTQNLLLDTTRNIVGFGEDETGELYLIGQAGTIERIVRASVSVSGQVLGANGLGLRNATVFITDAGGNIRRTSTSSLGYYQLDNVDTGQTYTINVVSRRYRFEAKTLNVSNELTNIDFMGLE